MHIHNKINEYIQNKTKIAKGGVPKALLNR